jgi:hypothetical protein
VRTSRTRWLTTTTSHGRIRYPPTWRTEYYTPTTSKFEQDRIKNKQMLRFKKRTNPRSYSASTSYNDTSLKTRKKTKSIEGLYRGNFFERLKASFKWIWPSTILFRPNNHGYPVGIYQCDTVPVWYTVRYTFYVYRTGKLRLQLRIRTPSTNHQEEANTYINQYT